MIDFLTKKKQPKNKKKKNKLNAKDRNLGWKESRFISLNENEFSCLWKIGRFDNKYILSPSIWNLLLFVPRLLLLYTISSSFSIFPLSFCLGHVSPSFGLLYMLIIVQLSSCLCWVSSPCPYDFFSLPILSWQITEKHQVTNFSFLI